MSYDTKQHGRAEYNHFMHIPLSELSSVVEGANSQDLKDRKYAIYTYQVNQVPINLSGEVVVDDVRIKGQNGPDVYATSDNELYVHDAKVLSGINAVQTAIQNTTSGTNELSIKETYSRIIQQDVSGNTYIMHSEPGNTSGESTWRIQKIDGNGSKQWPNSDNTFSYAASAYLSLSYAY